MDKFYDDLIITLLLLIIFLCFQKFFPNFIVIAKSFAGLAFPPLYFYNGGVRDFLATIKQNVFLVRFVILAIDG